MCMLEKSSHDLDRLADRVRLDDPSLSNLWLEPDGKYQTLGFALAAMTSEIVAILSRAFKERATDDFPTLYYGWGRCRVGSTALCNLFGTAGLPAYFQPVKSAMRNVLTGSAPVPWILPAAAEQPHVFSKEVAGPYLMAECLYIPLQILIEAGYPPDRLHLIMLDRDPVLSLASWLNKWSDRVPRDRLLKHFVVASLNAVRVEGYAARQGVATSHYIHEASREPVRAAAALFHRLGLSDRFSAAAVTDWDGVEAFDTDRSSLIFTPEPDVYFVPDIHRAGPGYRYLDRNRGLVTDGDLDLLNRMGIPDLYRACAVACLRELQLSLDLSGTMLGQPLAFSPAP